MGDSTAAGKTVARSYIAIPENIADPTSRIASDRLSVTREQVIMRH